MGQSPERCEELKDLSKYQRQCFTFKYFHVTKFSWIQILVNVVLYEERVADNLLVLLQEVFAAGDGGSC